MTKKKKSEDEPALVDGKPWFENREFVDNLKGAFANLGPRRGEAECMLHVYYSGYDPAHPDANPHMMREKVTADLGFVPDPPFTYEEMNTVMYYAKQGAWEVMERRAKAKREAAKAERVARKAAKATKP